MRTIQLTRVKVTVVDDADYIWLSQWSWQAQECGDGQRWYAVRTIWNGPQESHQLKMHREILGLPLGDPRYGDHRNGDGLDNQRDNLRVSDAALNAYNRRLNANSTSGYKGVSLKKWRRSESWIAQIQSDGTKIHLGSFETAEAAARAYDMAAMKYHGEFAKLNFP